MREESPSIPRSLFAGQKGPRTDLARRATPRTTIRPPARRPARGERPTERSNGGMGGKRRAEGEAAVEGGAASKRQALELSVHGGAGSEEAHSSGKEQFGSVARSHADLARSHDELSRSHAALARSHAELSRFELPRSVLLAISSPSEQSVLETVHLCSALSEGGDAGLIKQSTLRRLNDITEPIPHGWCSDAIAFQQRSWGWKGSLHQWLQAASQEPDASFLSGGAALSAQRLGMPLIRWADKQQGKYPGLETLTGFELVMSMAVSKNGGRIDTGSYDKLVKIWNAATGAEVLTIGHTCSGGCICTKDFDVNPECMAKGHSDPVRSVAFSSDGTRVVSAGDDKLVKIWNATTGAEVRTMGHSCTEPCICIKENTGGLVVKPACPAAGHTSWVQSVGFSPNGSRVISGSVDKLVKIWDVESGENVWTSRTHDGKDGCICKQGYPVTVNDECKVTRHAAKVCAVAFSPSGKLFISGSDNVMIWDAKTFSHVRTLPGHSKSVAFSPDSKRVVSGSNCGLITIWTVNGDKVCTMQHDRCAPYCNMCVYSVAFSPDAAGKWIVSGASDNLVKIWNAKTGKEIRTLTGHSKLVTSVAFLAGGKQVVSGSHDALVKIWDAEIEPEVHDETATSPAFSEDEKRFISNIKVRTRDGNLVVYSPDRNHVASGWDCLVKIWDVKKKEEPVLTIGHTGVGSCKCTKRDTYPYLVVKPDCQVEGHHSRVLSVAFSSNGTRVISGSDDNLVKIWDATNGDNIRTLGHSCTGNCICTRRMTSCGSSVEEDDFARLVINPACEEISHSGGVRSVAFSPDGTHVVSGSDDCSVKIWNAVTGEQILSSGEHNGKGLCKCKVDEYGCLEEDDDRKPIVNPGCPVTAHLGCVTRVKFSDDGGQVISASDDNTVRVWDVASRTQVRELAGDDFALVDGLSEKHKKFRHVVTSCGDTLKIYRVAKNQQHAEDGATAPVACFKAPDRITFFRCHGSAIVVRCVGGQKCVLSAPFLAV